MTYEEYLNQAKKFEAQAETLRKQAEEIRAKAEKQDQFHKELTEVRSRVISSVIEYLVKLDIVPETKEDYDTLVSTFKATLKELEDTVFETKKLI